MSGYMNKKHSRYPQKAKNDDNPEGVAKKMKKNAFFCRSVWPVFTQFLLFGKYLTFPCLLVGMKKKQYLCSEK